MHTLLLALCHLCSTNQVSAGKALIGCDNKGVICQLGRSPSYVPGSSKHADLIRAIRATRDACPLTLQFRYIAGHQDNFSRLEDLPLPAQLNVQADTMAKQALHLLGSKNASPVFSPLSGVRWTLAISGSPVSSDPRPPLLYHLSSRSAIPYWV